MMTPMESENERFMSVIRKLPFTKEQLEIIEKYLKGEADVEALDSFKPQDVSGMDGTECAALVRGELNKKRYGNAGKLINIFFALGHSTSRVLILQEYVFYNYMNFVTNVSAVKNTVIYATMCSHDAYRLGNGIFYKNLFEYAGKSTGVLKEALKYVNEKESNTKMYLLTAYFLFKYGSNNGNTGITGAINRLLHKNSGIQMEAEDRKLLEELENLIIGNLGQVITDRDGASTEYVRLAILNDRFDENAFLFAAKCILSRSAEAKLLISEAYLNYAISEKFRQLLSFLVKIDAKEILDIMDLAGNGLTVGKVSMAGHGQEYDKLFGIDAEKYISWALEKRHKEILRAQLKNNEESFLKVMETAELEASAYMFDIIKSSNLILYNRLLNERKKDGGSKEKEKLISEMVGKGTDAQLFADYLRGNARVETIIPHTDATNGWYGYGKFVATVKAFEDRYGDTAFIDKCNTYMALKGAQYYLTGIVRDDHGVGSITSEERIRQLFEGFEREKLPKKNQIDIAAVLYDNMYSDNDKNKVVNTAIQVFNDYLKNDREATAGGLMAAGATGRMLAVLIYGAEPENYKQEILAYASDSSKAVKEKLISLLCAQPGWIEEVTALLDSKKAGERELAVKVLAKWGGHDDVLWSAYEKEKNAKVRSLIESSFNIEAKDNEGTVTRTKEDIVKDIHKGGRKRSLAWAYENATFPVVHKKTGEAAEEEYLQAILLCYSSMDKCGVNATATELAAELVENELALYVNELFDRWMESGAEAKKKWVLYASAIHGGTDIVDKLKHNLSEWPKNARGAIAAEAVQALALNPLPQALLIVDGISRKFKFRQVKDAAAKALDFAAKQLGLTTEQLADRIVPDLGFDENMERQFDYGERRFTVTITPALEIEVYDEGGKKLKNLPAPGKKDDEEKAAAAYEEFKQLKKQMKATVTSQKARLEMALSAKRLWITRDWKKLFVQNPVMHQFAIGLIWGVYDNSGLVQSFRYMEDGSFNTDEEEEYKIPDNVRIGLVHPIELAKECRDNWEQQLEDYEITQPFEQLKRPVFEVTDEERNSKKLERFGGCIINDMSLGSKLQALGWYRGSIQDAGGFYEYYREDESAGFGAELNFSGSFVGGGYDEDVTIYDARFYKAGTVERGSYVYDRADDKKSIVLGEVPARYFSEVVLQLQKVTANCTEKDADWKKHR